MQAISKNSIVYTARGPFIVVGCGNGRYTLQPMGSKSRYSMPCDEFHEAIKSGKAIIGNKDALKKHETTRSYLADHKRYIAYLNASNAEQVVA